MFQIEIWYNDNTFDTFESVSSIEIAIGPTHRKLTSLDIKNIEFGSSKDIYIFNDKSHLIPASSFKRLTISEL